MKTRLLKRLRQRHSTAGGLADIRNDKHNQVLYDYPVNAQALFRSDTDTGATLPQEADIR